MNFDIVGGKETKFPGIAVKNQCPDIFQYISQQMFCWTYTSVYLKFDVHIAG